MLRDQSVLLEQIHVAITKNSCRNDVEIKNQLEEQESLSAESELNDKNYYSYTRNRELLKKLELRIDALEILNDRLLYFIHFLYKNFPDLVHDIIATSTEEQGAEKGLGGNSHYGSKNETPSLTPRELEILHLLVKGLCAKEIANRLYISSTTVITHKRHLKEKFNARNTAELISRAFNILLDPPISR